MAKREHLLKVCKAIIDNPRRVDADAVAAFRKAVLQYADVQNIDRGQALKIYDSEGEVGVMVRAAFDQIDASNVLKDLDDQEYSIVTGASYPRGRLFSAVHEDPDDEDERDDDDADVGKANHHASVVADLLVESGRFSTRPDALHHLLHTPAGQGLLSRMKKTAETEREKPMESIAKIVKDAGFIAVAKAIADGRSYGLTEAQFVELATEDAVKKFPGETPARAFTRSFTDGGADGLVIRRAHRVVRDEQLGSTYAKADRSEGTAYAELMSKAEEYRNAHPELSISQAFEKIYTAPANIALAKRERVESALR